MMITTAALAADTPLDPPRELNFKIASATVQKFERPLRARSGEYDVALVLTLDVVRSDWEILPPDIETYLYIGKHELRPFANQLNTDRVTLVFHDPNWKDLQGGETMVLTTVHGDPINNPEKYKGYPQFDPSIIK